MTDAERQAARRDAFTLSMVDLFGCGFIAATFLFIFNMLQPQIDAEERTGALAAGASGRAGTGQSGPVFVSIVSSQKLSCMEQTSTGEGPFYYEYIVPDSADLSWPYRITPCLTEPSTPATLGVRLTLSGQTTGIGIAGWSDDKQLAIRFSLDPELKVDIDRDWENALQVDLLTRRRDRSAFSGRFFFRSPNPINAAVKWSGIVETVEVQRNGGERLRLRIGDSNADCTIIVDDLQKHQFAYCGSVQDGLPDPATELSRMSTKIFAPETCLSKTSFGTPACLPTVTENCQLLVNLSCGTLQELPSLRGPS